MPDSRLTYIPSEEYKVNLGRKSTMPDRVILATGPSGRWAGCRQRKFANPTLK
jgi:hypothetical protein